MEKNIRLRSACKRDISYIDGLFVKNGFKLDTDHLERLIVSVDDEDKILGILYLNTVLEASFITDEDLPKRSRIRSLSLLVEQGKREVKAIGYDLVHAFANDKTEGILVKHFGFEAGKGVNLILFVE